MVKVTQRLTREDWILAGFRALAKGGATALKVEPVASDLGTSKGSFYWHFADQMAWRTAMLRYWEDKAYVQIVAALDAVPLGLPRLHALSRMATMTGRDPSHGGTAAEPALREWARYAPDVAAIVGRVDAGRIDFVAACLRDATGSEQDHILQARQVYAVHLGLEALRGDPEQDTETLIDLINRLCRTD